MKRIFGKKEGKGSSTANPSLPQLPTTREMLEDIENIKKSDPILSLASVVDTTGRHSVVDTVDTELTDYIEAWTRRKRRESGTLSSVHTVYSVLGPAGVSGLRRRHLSSARTRTNSSSSTEAEQRFAARDLYPLQDRSELFASSEDDKDKEPNLNYDKIKHFLTTLEYSEEVMEAIDAEITRLFGNIDEMPFIKKHIEKQKKAVSDSLK